MHAFSQRNQELGSDRRALRTSFSTICVHSRTPQSRRCPKKPHAGFSLVNQGLSYRLAALLTIFSTKSVKKRTGARLAWPFHRGQDYTVSAADRDGILAKRARRQSCPVCLKFGLAPLCSMKSRTWTASDWLAHIVFHSLCAKPSLGTRTNLLRCINTNCLKLVQEAFSLINQRACSCCVRLRTILSTKNVKKVVVNLAPRPSFALPKF